MCALHARITHGKIDGNCGVVNLRRFLSYQRVSTRAMSLARVLYSLLRLREDRFLLHCIPVGISFIIFLSARLVDTPNLEPVLLLFFGLKLCGTLF